MAIKTEQAPALLSENHEHPANPDTLHAVSAMAIEQTFDDDWWLEDAEPYEDISLSRAETGGIELSDEELTDERTVVDTLNRQHYVRSAPRFEDQAADPSRTNLITSILDGEVVNMTEHEALVAAQDYLVGAIAEFRQVLPGHTRMRQFTESLLDEVTFIGEKEYAEGVHGLAATWKGYLDEDKNRQLCVPTLISEKNGQRKSDVYLFERILDTFSDEELQAYSGRIVTRLEDVAAKPKDTKIVLLDDWSISGLQMNAAYKDLQGSKTRRGAFGKYAESVEIHQLVASEDRIEQGQQLEVAGGKVRVPVKAYFKAHAAGDTTRTTARITGAHSSVDIDFEQRVDSIISPLNWSRSKEGWDELPQMPLTNIIRPYRNSAPLVVIDHDGTIRRNHNNEQPDSSTEYGKAT